MSVGEVWRAQWALFSSISSAALERAGRPEVGGRPKTAARHREREMLRPAASTGEPAERSIDWISSAWGCDLSTSWVIELSER